MFLDSYKKAIEVLSKKPFMLWGLSLMGMLIAVVGGIMFGVIPGVGIAIAYLISCGMAKIYLDGLVGKEVCSDQLFIGFNKNGFRMAGAMAWKDLWVLIWALIPIVGPVFAIIKSYEYHFVPYIMVTYPNVKATEALRVSKKLTNGLKLQMFLADICIGAIVFGVFLILSLLALIPILGILFGLVLFALYIVIIALGPIFSGLYQSYFFAVCSGIIKPQQAPVQQAPAQQGYQPQSYQPKNYPPQNNQ